MKLIRKRIAGTVVAMALFATSACDQAASVEKSLPEGEDAFTCGALIHAAANQVDDVAYKTDVDAIKKNSIALITHYGTMYATPKNMDGYEAFQRMKIKGMGYAGIPSGDADELPTAELIQRAKACADAA